MLSVFSLWPESFNLSWLRDRFSRKSRNDIFNQSMALWPRNLNSSGLQGRRNPEERTYCKWRGSHFIVCPALHSPMSQLKMNFRKSYLGMVVENCCTFGFYLEIHCGTTFELLSSVRNAFHWWVQLLRIAQTGDRKKNTLEDPRWVRINSQSWRLVKSSTEVKISVIINKMLEFLEIHG